jgi:Enoyl-(Acyl carrier protein) reductase
VAERAAGLAGQAGTFSGWVNNAAVFRDAWLHEGGSGVVMGLTRALAVDYGPRSIRVNAVALGSVGTERYEELLGRQGPDPEAVGTSPPRS